MSKLLRLASNFSLLTIVLVSCTPRTFYPNHWRLVPEKPSKDDKTQNASNGDGQLGELKPLDGEGEPTQNRKPEKTPEDPPYESPMQEYVGTQTAGDGLPSGINVFTWVRPATYTLLGAFIGREGKIASHEGVDYVHTNGLIVDVPVVAAGAGRVVYVRTGCLQSSMFSSNTQIRECGAGWGEHVVIDHGSGIYTRYAHLKPKSIVVKNGQDVSAGERIGIMGNSGRSEVRHLHFELGTKSNPFIRTESSQPFDKVYDSEKLFPY